MSPLLVLVVEDDYLLRIVAVSFLEDAGFETLEARSADEAITLLEDRKDIRMVFTDIDMPGSMDGLRLAHVIRNRWPPIELLIASGHIRPREEELPAGGTFLKKPYDGQELVGAVKSLVL